MCPFNQLEKTNISKTHKDHTSTKSQPEHNTLKNLITVIAAKITITLYTSPQSPFLNFRKIPITHPISFPKNIKKEQPPHSSTNPRHTANLPLTAQIIPQPPPHKLRTKNGQQRSCFPFFLSRFNLQSRSLPKSRKIPLSRPHYECALRWGSPLRVPDACAHIKETMGRGLRGRELAQPEVRAGSIVRRAVVFLSAQ